MSIVTDAALVALPIMVIYPLNMRLGERLIVMLFYCTRALLVLPTHLWVLCADTGKNHPRYNLPDRLHPTASGPQLHASRVPLFHLRPGGPVSQFPSCVRCLLLALHQVVARRPGTIQRHQHDFGVCPDK